MGSEGQPKLRALAFHGFRTNGAFMKKQLSKWDPRIHDLLDITYLDAPFPAQGPSEIEAIFPGPYFEFMQSNEDFTEFYNYEDAIAFIADYMEKNGPFDGLIGFSQGCVLGGCLVACQDKGKVMKGKSLAALPRLQFYISIAGAYLRDKGIVEVYTPPIDCSSLHMIGDKDFMRIPAEEFLQYWKDPVLLRNPQGHTVPRLDEAAVSTVVSFLEKVLEKKAEPAPIEK